MNDFIPYYWEGKKQTSQGLYYRVRLAEHVLYASDDTSMAGKMGNPETGHPERKPEATMFSYSYIAMPDDETNKVAEADKKPCNDDADVDVHGLDCARDNRGVTVDFHKEGVGNTTATGNANEARPIIFAYNGGPGAASAWLHMGLLGPTLAKVEGYPDNLQNPAEYKLEANPDFLLDKYDIVLIDPVGTGWARLLDESAASRHYSTAGDAQDFADFICTWLRGNNREKSPVYLLGESYGTIRNVALADVLPENVNLQGIIHIGTSLNVGARTTIMVEPNVRRLGANAAVCWYHHHQGDCNRESFVKNAMDFAYGDYAHALLMGSRLSAESRKSVLERLATFTGMDKTFLNQHNLRFGEVDFLLGCCPGSVVSTYDARLLYHPKATEKYSENAMASAGIIEPDMNQDAFMSAVGPIYDQALRAYVERELCVPDRAMATDMMNIAFKWDYRGFEKDTLTLPVELMQRRPDLRMLFVNGYYDLQSTFDFVTYYLSRFNLPADRVHHAVLPSGHASYVGDGMVEMLNRELRDFIEQR